VVEGNCVLGAGAKLSHLGVRPYLRCLLTWSIRHPNIIYINYFLHCFSLPLGLPGLFGRVSQPKRNRPIAFTLPGLLSAFTPAEAPHLNQKMIGGWPATRALPLMGSRVVRLPLTATVHIQYLDQDYPAPEGASSFS
jgi:hypothetical protein